MDDNNSSEDIAHSNSASSEAPPRPRLPTPNIFRDIFDEDRNSRSRRSVVLPPLHSHDTLRHVRDALERADAAVRNAREAFRSTRSDTAQASATTAPHTQSVVDLTQTISSETSNPTDLFLARHPDDSARGMSAIRNTNSLHEPLLYNSRMPPARHNIAPHELQHGMNGNGWFIGPVATLAPNDQPVAQWRRQRMRRDAQEHSRNDDEAAVRRQRRAHRDWERNRRYRRELEQRQERERAGRDGPISNSSPSGSRPTTADSESSISITQPTNNDGATAMTPVDLTNVDDNASLSAVLAKQRQDAIASQKSDSKPEASSSGAEPRTALSGYKCAICMDAPTAATTTKCGHLFCHKCIVDSLEWSVRQIRTANDYRPTKSVRGTCPVCRNSLSMLAKKDKGIVALEIKTVPRKWFEESRKKAGKKRVNADSEEEVVDIDDLSPEDKAAQAMRDKGKYSGKRPVKKPKLEDSEGSDELLNELFGEFIQDSS